MPRSKPHTLLCTVGVSLFYPNLTGRLGERMKTDSALVPLSRAYADGNWQAVAQHLRHLDPDDDLCGAEINSVARLLRQQRVDSQRLCLLHSDTDDGRVVAQVLKIFFAAGDWRKVEVYCIEGLRDDDPALFRTCGLRNLAKELGCIVRASSAEFCAVDATGGYKAQIAVATLMGQALGIPVFYRHERFKEIISFPPMPVSLDFTLWQRCNGMFHALAHNNACEPQSRFVAEWDDRLESLVNRVEIDGVDHLELSAMGQIFHETFRARFRPTLLPAVEPHQKQRPELGDHNYGRARAHITRFLQRIIDEKPYVRTCRTRYWNKGQPESTRFVRVDNYVEGLFSQGSWHVKFRVDTTNTDADAIPEIVADLNEWHNR